jgi:hypothetical protein
VCVRVRVRVRCVRVFAQTRESGAGLIGNPASGELEAHLAGDLIVGASVNETKEEDEHIGVWVTQRP